MGNCLLGGLGPETTDPYGIAKVITSNGAVMEFYTPVAAGPITDQFPGHGIFRDHESSLFWKSLSPHEELEPGESYFLLPSLKNLSSVTKCGQVKHVRSKSVPDGSNRVRAPPYRLSVDHPTGRSSGVWKVKLVITPEELMEILSQESRTQELVESMRAVAKCSSAVTTWSDQWSRSSSRNASSKNDGLVMEI